MGVKALIVNLVGARLSRRGYLDSVVLLYVRDLTTVHGTPSGSCLMLSQHHSYLSLLPLRHWYDFLVTCSLLFDVAFVQLAVHMNDSRERSLIRESPLLNMRRQFLITIISISGMKFCQKCTCLDTTIALREGIKTL